MLFDNENANLVPHYIKAMNINIYACVLLSQLDFNSFDKCFSEKLDTFSTALSGYSYHKHISCSIQNYVDPSLIMSFCIYKDIDPTHFFNNTHYCLKNRVEWIKKTTDRYFQYYNICHKIGLLKSLDISISRPMLSPNDFDSITTSILNTKLKEYGKTHITTSKKSLSSRLFNNERAIHNLTLSANIKINALPPLKKTRCIQLWEFLSNSEIQNSETINKLSSANSTKGIISEDKITFKMT